MSQTCRSGQTTVACGREAANALATQIGSADISCDAKDRDSYGRTVAICYSAGTDLNGWMVERGYAVAYRLYSRDYVAAEGRASGARAGIWQYEFKMPWHWRDAHSRAAVPLPAGTETHPMLHGVNLYKPGGIEGPYSAS